MYIANWLYVNYVYVFVEKDQNKIGEKYFSGYSPHIADEYQQDMKKMNANIKLERITN